MWSMHSVWCKREGVVYKTEYASQDISEPNLCHKSNFRILRSVPLLLFKYSCSGLRIADRKRRSPRVKKVFLLISLVIAISTLSIAANENGNGNGYAYGNANGNGNGHGNGNGN